MKQKLLSTKTIIIIPVLFIITIIANIWFNYTDNKSKIYDFAQKQAQTLNSFMIVHRDYYQKLYLEKTIPLNEKTLSGLPAFAAFDISKKFSQENIFNISIQTVSNKARNEKNKADKNEQKAIDYFNNNKDQKEYFNLEEEYFQYATPLFINKKCLACHGKKEDAPAFISKRYDNAYDYKVGELRGIVSIKIPKNSVSDYFTFSFIKNVLFDFFIVLIVLIVTIYLVRYFRDISTGLKDEVDNKTKELRENMLLLDRYKIAMDESSIVTKSDLEGNITYVNDKFIEITGYTKEEVIGKSHSIVRHPDTKIEVFEDMWQTIKAKRIWKGILKNRGRKSNEYWIDMTIVPILDTKGDIVEYIAIRHEITEMINQEEKLKQIVNTDLLTGYGSRYKLKNDIKESTQFALAILDVDNFSQINDFYGHEIGDLVIKNLADIIAKGIEKEDCELYHLQGDEFAIFNNKISSQRFIEKIKLLVERISKTSIDQNGEKLNLNITTAISFEEGNDLLKTADMAMKVAKKDQKELVVYTSEISLDKEYENNIKWAKKIKQAIISDNIVPVFQPIVNNHNGKWEKYESLVRLVDEDDNFITPYHFLDISKQTRYYTQITKTMIKKSFDMFKAKDVKFSINLTIEDILNEDIKEYIFNMLEEYEIGSRVVFEIVESESIMNFEEIISFINRVKSYGCKIAIDDFGTGYSNFEYLLKLQSDYIKIDGSMIKDIDTNEQTRLVVSTIVDFAKKMGIKTVAEFVENESIEKVVKELGIDYCQGYHFSKPKTTL